ncbi:MAG: hypothetical protein H6582_02745 [Crocinitomicaceae bacterium]|nr:hypothetical protein [Crocinitomicaceae bacterium]
MKRWIFSLLVLFLANNVFADSPLTSTPFWQAYENDKEVMYAKENGLNDKVLKSLLSKKTTGDVKIAIINCFGWGSGYTEKFENYLIEKRKGLTKDVFRYLKMESEDMPAENDQTKLLTTDDLVCWSYLRAMDNYQTPQYSMRGAFLAYWRDTTNMAAGIVLCLIAGQQAMMFDWCKIYESAQMFIVNADYKVNILKEDAVNIILEYLNLYEQDCQ